MFRNFDVLGVENDRTVRITDFARGETERDIRVWRLSLFGEAPLNPHFLPLQIAFFSTSAPSGSSA
jgi:hypothetical protein